MGKHITTLKWTAQVAEWTDEQCMRFMSVGLRHVKYAGDDNAGPTFNEIRQGVRAALEAETDEHPTSERREEDSERRARAESEAGDVEPWSATP
jgi:hypothetical protein